MCKTYYKRTIFSLSILSASHCLAGPPFLTDDPVPTDYKHFEILPFISSGNTQQNSNIEGPAVEIDYGMMKNAEISATIFIDSNIAHGTNGPSAVGLGDIQLGMVYRFIQETDYHPQVAFNPQYFIPTGDSHRQLGNGRPYFTLPLWAQKSWGSWTTYGGGGYTYNPAPGEINNFFGGWLLKKDLNEKWTLGGEIYIQGAINNNTPTSYIINLGGNYNITKSVSFLFSSGHSVKGGVNLVGYVGLDIAL